MISILGGISTGIWTKVWHCSYGTNVGVTFKTWTMDACTRHGTGKYKGIELYSLSFHSCCYSSNTFCSYSCLFSCHGYFWIQIYPDLDVLDVVWTEWRPFSFTDCFLALRCSCFFWEMCAAWDKGLESSAAALSKSQSLEPWLVDEAHHCAFTWIGIY